MSLNWNDMRYFLGLCRKKTMVSAAGGLKVTHTTVARRISVLEEALGTQLFHRTEKGCYPTPAGEKLLPFAEQLENTALDIKASVAGHNHQVSGAIRIGAPDGLGNCYLAPRLGRLRTLHPDLDVELVAVPAYYSLSKREIDILITVRKPAGGNVVLRKLTSYRLGMFASREYLTAAPPIKDKPDLKAHSFIGYIDDLLFDDDLNFMEEISPGLTVKFRSSTVVAQMNAAASGAGIGVIPYFMARDRSDLVPVLPGISIERGYWLQVNPDSRQLARVRATMDFLVDQAGECRPLFLSLPSARIKK